MSKFREIKVGIFAVISIVIFYFGFNYLKGIDFLSKSKKFYTVYDDVAGLAVSNPVKISGFTIGKVSDIDILQERNNRILVEMDINKDIILGEGTNALLHIDLLGSVSIILDVGDINKPLEPGDTIVSKVDPSLEALVKESALPIAQNLNLAIVKLDNILEELVNKREVIGKSIDNLEGITGKVDRMLAKNDAALTAAVSDLPKITSKLDSNMMQLTSILGKFDNVADSVLMMDLQSTAANLNEVMENLNQTLAGINEGSGTVGKLLKDEELYNNLNQTLTDLDTLLVHMNTYPKHFFAPLGKSRKKIEKEMEKEN